MRDRSVFINCPFDDDYAPLLQAILFTLVFLGYEPRLSSEQIDSVSTRMDRISDLIVSCQFSIHDLSRCIAKRKGELYRLNMPFELGIDYGLRMNGGPAHADKEILILSEKPYTHTAALSDLAGCDVEAHGGDYEKVVRRVRNWFSERTNADVPPPTVILSKYFGFQEWHFERESARGASEEDIKAYPTSELLAAMRDWNDADRPDSFD